MPPFCASALSSSAPSASPFSAASATCHPQTVFSTAPHSISPADAVLPCPKSLRRTTVVTLFLAKLTLIGTSKSVHKLQPLKIVDLE